MTPAPRIFRPAALRWTISTSDGGLLVAHLSPGNLGGATGATRTLRVAHFGPGAPALEGQIAVLGTSSVTETSGHPEGVLYLASTPMLTLAKPAALALWLAVALDLVGWHASGLMAPNNLLALDATSANPRLRPDYWDPLRAAGLFSGAHNVLSVPMILRARPDLPVRTLVAAVTGGHAVGPSLLPTSPRDPAALAQMLLDRAQGRPGPWDHWASYHVSWAVASLGVAVREGRLSFAAVDHLQREASRGSRAVSQFSRSSFDALLTALRPRTLHEVRRLIAVLGDQRSALPLVQFLDLLEPRFQAAAWSCALARAFGQRTSQRASLLFDGKDALVQHAPLDALSALPPAALARACASPHPSVRERAILSLGTSPSPASAAPRRGAAR